MKCPACGFSDEPMRCKKCGAELDARVDIYDVGIDGSLVHVKCPGAEEPPPPVVDPL